MAVKLFRKISRTSSLCFNPDKSDIPQLIRINNSWHDYHLSALQIIGIWVRKAVEVKTQFTDWDAQKWTEYEYEYISEM